MFGSQIFHSWFSVILGACFFAVLFSLIGMMSELVLSGEMRLTNQALSLGSLAFVGYVGVAAFIRMNRG